MSPKLVRTYQQGNDNGTYNYFWDWCHEKVFPNKFEVHIFATIKTKMALLFWCSQLMLLVELQCRQKQTPTLWAPLPPTTSTYFTNCFSIVMLSKDRLRIPGCFLFNCHTQIFQSDTHHYKHFSLVENLTQTMSYSKNLKSLPWECSTLWSSLNKTLNITNSYWNSDKCQRIPNS